MTSSIRGSGFGPRPPPLLEYLQQILRGYSDGQILKELLQNAEDAGASEVYFLYDQRQFGTSKLLNPQLSKFQGPAVYSFNNAEFSESDWEAIQKPARSEKKEDVLKVGRFGIGFSSVYHLTDLPCIVSGNKLAFIDPSEEYFTEGRRPVPGYQYRLSDVVGRDDCSHQMAPFLEVFEDKQSIRQKHHLNGTLFRFPLRTVPSELSINVYNQTETTKLLQAFQEDALVVLLFLRNVEKISVLRRNPTASTTSLSLQVSLASADIQYLRRQRSQFNEQLAAHQSNPNGNRNDIELSENFEITCDGNVQRWITAQKISYNASKGIQDLSSSLHYLPWVGVAIPVTSGVQKQTKGRIFCFLPLPYGNESCSGLPVHIHGYFGVSDDRRSIKWPGSDQIQNPTARWNKLLVEEILPGVYLKAILKTIEFSQSKRSDPSSVYSALPDTSCDLGHWKSMVKTLYTLLFQHPVLFVESSKSWRRVSDTVIFNAVVKEELRPVINKCLRLGGSNVVEKLPPHVLRAVKDFACNAVYVDRVQVLKSIRAQSLSNYTANERRLLLVYLLQQGCSSVDLDCLELLHMEDGSFRSIAAYPSADQLVFLPASGSYGNLLPHLPYRFVHPSLYQSLQTWGLTGSLSQVRSLNPTLVTQLLKQTLPNLWNGRSETYQSNLFDWQWLKRVWDFTYHHRNLGQLEGLNLLPLTNENTYPLKLKPLSKSLLIIQSDTGTEKNYPDLVHMLRLLNVTIRPLPLFITNNPDLGRLGFVRKFNADGVLSCLKSIGTTTIGQKCSGDPERCFRFQENLLCFLMRSRNLTAQEKGFLKQLNIYRAYSTKQSNFIVNLNSSIPLLIDSSMTNLPNVQFPQSVLFTPNSEIRVFLLNHFNVPQKSYGSMVVSILTHAKNSGFSITDKQVLVTWIANHYDKLRSIIGVNALLKQIPFIPNGRNQERCAAALFDPADALLQQMYKDDSRFPSATFLRQSNWRNILPKIGYKDRSTVDAIELLMIANRIQSSGDLQQAKAFCQFLTAMPHLLTSDLQNSLNNICCVPCVTHRPASYPKGIRFMGEASGDVLCTPSQVVQYSEENARLAGSMVYYASTDVPQGIRGRSQPSPQQVCSHLHQMATCRLQVAELSTMLHTVYGFLNNFAVESYIQHLPAKWVWVGHKFAAPSEVCRRRTEIDLQPFLYNIPMEYRGYHNLYEVLTGPEIINTDDLLNILSKVKDRLDGSPHDAQCLVDLSLRILKRLVDTEEDLSSRFRDQLYVPTQDSRLLPPDEVTFCDYDWLTQHQSADDDQQDIIFINDEISIKMSLMLGVTPLRSRLLNAFEIEGISQTGQYESITTRIKNILNSAGYQSTSIPKEMIQNAEDAGASEVRFLIDLRSNRNALQRLLDEGMKSLQGPALWVYNDSIFTDSDLDNITQLAGGTKANDGSKIGQFGVGFNSVYHLTDVPSFVSRHFVNFFDPHKRFLGAQIRRDGRGIRIDFKKNPSCLKRFQDQFAPFEGIFGCNLLDSTPEEYDGTLFRLPLRTENDAKSSDICSESWDEAKLKRLIETLCDTAGQMMLFTENVKNISVHLLREGHDTTLVFTAKKQFTKQANAPISFRKSVLNSLKKQDMMLPPDSLKDIEFNYMWTEEGHRYFQRTGGTLEWSQEWVVVASTGYGKSISLCRERFLRDNSLLPCGGVAWEYSGTLDGQGFCFLPLSIPKSHLPVHVNGSFALSDDRGRLWRYSESSIDSDATFKGQWNDALFEDVILKAYLKLLQGIFTRGKYTSEAQAYYALWPNPHITPANGEYGTLVRSFYSAVAKGINNTPISLFWHPQLRKQLSLKKVAFVDDRIGDDPNIFSIVDAALQRICKVQLVLQLPDHVLEGFRQANCSDIIGSKTFFFPSFFENVFIPHIETFSEVQVNSILFYALEEGDPEVLSKMKGNKCIPTSSLELRAYKKPCELFDPETFGNMFLPDEGFYPRQDFLQCLNDRQKGALRDMGCLKVTLDWSMVYERAQTVQVLNERDIKLAKQRSNAVLEILQKKLIDGDDHSKAKEFREKLINIPFLFGQDQHGNVHIKCSADLYLRSLSNVISTVRCTVDNVPNRAAKYLKLHEKKPPPSLVLEHLLNLKNDARQKEQADGFIKQCCLATYKFLQSSHLDEEYVLRFLRTEECFYLDGEFVPATKLSFQSEPVPPYIFRVNSDLRDFDILLRKAGVSNDFPNDYLIKTLHALAEDYHEQCLPKDLLDGVISKILKPLAERMRNTEPERWGPPYNADIYMPDAIGIMRKSTELSFCDVVWLDVDEIVLCHSDITVNQATILGVKDIRHQLLDRISEDVYPGEEFGQKEDLTRRLKRILTGYPCDVSILKEIIQNADDAGAMKVHFVLDKREHHGDKLLSDSMKEIQGPALLAYNDKQFTKDDIRGIQKLGEGSKSSQADKTGRYGVGFNVVYHLTDCPMFISGGNTLCVMDPTLRYVPGASPRSPGRKYIDVKSNIRKSYPDFYKCFGSLDGELALDEGTLFRFPLRHSRSEISSETWTTTSLQGWFDALKGELFDILLFLKNIQEIHISVVNEDGRLSNTHTATSHIAAEDKLQRDEFFQALHNHSETPITEIPAEDYSSTLTLKDSSGYQEKWLVHQRFGLEDQTVPVSITNAVKSNRLEMKLLPKGGVAARLPDLALLDTEGVVREVEYKAFCFLPLPILTHFPVHVDGYFALDHESRRNLWMGTTGDPKNDWNDLIQTKVIAPAYLKMLIKMKELLTSIAMERNISFRKFRLLLDHFHSMFPKCGYHDDNDLSSWDKVSESMYLEICKNKQPLFPVMDIPPTVGCNIIDITWHSCIEDSESLGYFNNLPKEVQQKGAQPDDGIEEWQILQQTLLELKFPLLATPINVYESIINALKNDARKRGVQSNDSNKLPVLKATPEVVLTFLRDTARFHSLQNLPRDLKETPIENTNKLMTLIEYVKQVTQFGRKLDMVPLLLTCDLKLGSFCTTSKTFYSVFAELLPNCGQKFLHRSLLGLFDSESDVFAEFKLEDLASRISTFLPEQFCTDDLVKWHRSDDKCGGLSRAWMKKFWKFVSHQRTDYHGKDFTQYVRLHLGRWALLPVRVKQDYSGEVGRKLPYDTHGNMVNRNMSLNMGHAALAPWPNDDDKKMHEFLVDLGCPVLDSHAFNDEDFSQVKWSYLEEDYTSIAQTFVGRIEHCGHVLSVLERLLRHSYQRFTDLTKEERNCIFDYFKRRVESLKKEDRSSLLRKLPCYETIDGKFVPLTKPSIVITAVGIPREDDKQWMDNYDCIFLKDHVIPGDLYTILEIKAIDEIQLYRDFILPNFGGFSEAGIWSHLLKLFNMVSSRPTEEDKLALVNQLNLRDRPLVLSKTGELKHACDLCDPDVTLFSIMLPENKFPQRLPKGRAQLVWYRYLDFLRLLGLQSVVSPAKLLEFAKDLRDNEGDNEITYRGAKVRKDETLYEHFRANHNLHTNTDLINQLSTIEFVRAQPPHTKYHALSKSPATRKVTLKAVLCSNCSLVWSTELMCPVWVGSGYTCDVIRETKCIGNIKEMLGIMTKPNLQQVIRHTQTLCNALGNRTEIGDRSVTTKPELLCKVLSDIFKFLASHCKKVKDKEYNSFEQNKTCTDVSDCCEHCKTITDNLQCVPIVPVNDGTALFKAGMVTRNWNEDENNALGGYLKKIPDEFITFGSLFQCLGATKYPSITQYAKILESISTSRDVTTNPNRAAAATQAMSGFLKCLAHQHNDVSTMEVLERMPNLYFMSQNKARPLALSRELYHNDMPQFNKRLSGFPAPLLKEITQDDVGTTTNIEELLKCLPDHLRPLFISEHVKENMLTAPSAVLMANCNCPASKQLKRVLEWEQFPKAIECIVAHEMKQSDKESTGNAMKKLMRTRFSVKCVRKLETVLAFQGQQVPESRGETPCLFQEQLLASDRIEMTVYVSHRTTPNIRYHQLAVQFRSHFKLIKDNSILVLILQAESEEELSNSLNDAGIGSAGLEQNRLWKIPTLGTDIPRDVIALLNQDPMYIFQEREYVGYDVGVGEEELLIYARVVNRVVEDDISKLEPWQVRFEIDVGDRENLVVPGRKLFKFAPDPDPDRYALEPYDGPEDNVPPGPAAAASEGEFEGLNLEEVKKKISRTMEEINKLPEGEKKKMLKRLMLRWHPDKHAVNKEFMEEVFKHIQKEIDRWENRGAFNRQEFYEDVGRRARRDYDERRQWEQNFRRSNARRTQDEYASSGRPPPSFYGRRNTLGARRNLRQARVDFEVAQMELTTSDRTRQWKCQLYFFAAEKAIRAVQLACGREPRPGRGISVASESFRDELDLTNEVYRLIRIVNRDSHYPDNSSAGRIPMERFTEDNVRETETLCSDIIEKVEEFINHQGE